MIEVPSAYPTEFKVTSYNRKTVYPVAMSGDEGYILLSQKQVGLVRIGASVDCAGAFLCTQSGSWGSNASFPVQGRSNMSFGTAFNTPLAFPGPDPFSPSARYTYVVKFFDVLGIVLATKTLEIDVTD